MTRSDTSVVAMNDTWSADSGTRIIAGDFMIAELAIPTTATSAPGQRPAIVVASTMAGTKKRNVIRPWVIG
jgi:hypothetical protein